LTLRTPTSSKRLKAVFYIAGIDSFLFRGRSILGAAFSGCFLRDIEKAHHVGHQPRYFINVITDRLTVIPILLLLTYLYSILGIMKKIVSSHKHLLRMIRGWIIR